jgi:hypothetical protein
MIQPIMKDIFFLQQKSEPATQLDVQVGQDLQDTLVSQRSRLRGYGGQHDWRQKADNHRQHGLHQSGHVQSRPHQQGQALSDRGRLPVASRYWPYHSLSGN